ncbi:MAG: hypothetical protein ABJ387_01525 [Balneola sp.]
MKDFDTYTKDMDEKKEAVLNAEPEKIRFKHGYVSYLALYEIVAFISRVNVNNGKHSWQRIFKTFDEEEYKAKVDELLSSGCYEEVK